MPEWHILGKPVLKPFHGNNSCFFPQGFVSIKWHNPETWPHVNKYNSIGSPNKVRLVVFAMDRAEGSFPVSVLLLYLSYRCAKMWFPHPWVAGRKVLGLGAGPPGWETPVPFTAPKYPMYGTHVGTFCVCHDVKGVGRQWAWKCSISTCFQIRNCSLKSEHSTDLRLNLMRIVWATRVESWKPLTSSLYVQFAGMKRNVKVDCC